MIGDVHSVYLPVYIKNIFNMRNSVLRNVIQTATQALAYYSVDVVEVSRVWEENLDIYWIHTYCTD